MTNLEKANYIAGEWVGSDDLTENRNPSDLDDLVGLYARASAQQTHDAIASAKAALPSWSGASPQLRAEILERVGVELLARREELGALLSREEGKIISEGIGEVTRAAQLFKFYAQEALRVEGLAIASIRPGVRVEVRNEPVGVVGLITPWNFPIAIPAWKIAPALAFGNTVVFKPADLTPACGWALAEILSRSGLPAGVFNLVMGRGSVVGDVIAKSPDVNAVSFTGSEATGRGIRTIVAERGGKIQQEMGGKSPLVVLDDANLENAIDCAIGGSVISTGQRCTSNTRIIATPGIYDSLAEGMAARARKLVVGNALDPASQIGPVVDERQLSTNLRYIGIADGEGAERLCGGEVLDRPQRGFYLSPAVYANCTNDMVHVREEIFGPVVSVLKAADYDEALAIANDSDLGLSSGICTTSLKYSEDFKTRSTSGMVFVNLPTAGVDYHVPFGGRKASSYGPREQGRAAREFFTTSKTAYTNPL
ncbi:aldehyde dehydrogenase family protein [Mesorhizobium sp. SB112]|uniref:aldehyde dehydrogenase family protein n=1 Tax=Mesorhizobium sp. SB112 TaxID=3151853 RepID=UPI0032637FA3